MRILGIETSCDETAISIIETNEQDNINVLANIINSQIDLHKEFGGVFPTLAKREHAKNLVPVLIEALEKSNLIKANTSAEKLSPEELNNFFNKDPDLLASFSKVFEIEKPEIDLIAVTEGPGLEPALWVGIQFAKALSKLWQIPLAPINHMEGHIVSVLKGDTKIQTPAIALLISGGHTELVHVKEVGKYELIGQTKDDAIGEAFDKVARILGLPYPGGPEISKLAEEARAENLENFVVDSNGEKFEVKLPRPMLNTPDYFFSFSGLKTAVLYMEKKLEEKNLLNLKTKKIIAREFEDAATEVIFKKTKNALEEFHIQNLIIGGGVIANKNIRKEFQKLDAKIYMPDKEAITDNAQMIAIAGFLKSKNHKIEISPDISAHGNLSL